MLHIMPPNVLRDPAAPAPIRPRGALLRALLAAGAALLALRCGPKAGTDVGNGASVSLDLRAYQAPPSAKPQSLTLADGVRIDELWMVVDQIRLRPGSSCSGNDSDVDVEGPLVADLLEGGVLGGPAAFPVQAGPFCELRVGFHKLEGAPPVGAPADLQGRSLLIRGARADGVPFLVQSELGDRFELKAKGGAFSLPEGRSPLFLAYELDAWMSALDLASIPGASVVVSKDENKDRLDAFELAVKQSARLFRDQDDDGALSPAESTPDEVLAQ